MDFQALVLMVVVWSTTRGVVYCVDDSVGSLPSAVYRIVVPDNQCDIVTVCVVAYWPAAGVIAGMSSWPTTASPDRTTLKTAVPLTETAVSTRSGRTGATELVYSREPFL